MEVGRRMVLWVDVDAQTVYASDKLFDEIEAAVRPDVVSATQQTLQSRQCILDACCVNDLFVQLVGKESHCA